MRIFRSILVAVLIAAVVMAFSIRVLAPRLPRVVGRPDIVVERDLSLATADTLAIRNGTGPITIRTNNEDSFHVNVSVKGYAADGDIAGLQAYVSETVEVVESEKVCSIVSEPSGTPDAFEVLFGYDITVPVGTNIDLTNANGRVRIEEGCGAVSVETGNGGIRIAGPRGTVSAQTGNGRIKVYDALAQTTLTTVNGNIYAHIRGGSLVARTTNGSILARLLNPDVETCDLNTRNGAITVILDDRCAAAVSLETDNGVVRADVPLDDAATARRHVTGKVGDGGTTISARTQNGNVWLAGGGS